MTDQERNTDCIHLIPVQWPILVFFVPAFLILMTLIAFIMFILFLMFSSFAKNDFGLVISPIFILFALILEIWLFKPIFLNKTYEIIFEPNGIVFKHKKTRKILNEIDKSEINRVLVIIKEVPVRRYHVILHWNKKKQEKVELFNYTYPNDKEVQIKDIKNYMTKFYQIEIETKIERF